MESVVAAAVTGLLTLLGVLFSNSRSRAVMEYKLDQLDAKVAAHNRLVERMYSVEARVTLVEDDLQAVKGIQMRGGTR